MKLPLNNDKKDWTYMETLTQDIKKLVIKDLVVYIDQKILSIYSLFMIGL